MIYDCAIIGGGIVGLSTAMTLSRRQPRCSILLLEKEPGLALSARAARPRIPRSEMISATSNPVHS